MKIVFTIAAAVLFAASQTRADIIAGPITNPANGHDYYLLAPNSWTASEAEAENLGGTLAIVRNADEQKWIYMQFGSNGYAKRSLWIGLHRKTTGGPLVWVNGSPVDYTNWWEGEPNNKDSVESCVEMWGEVSAPGTWNDNMDAVLISGVAEVSDKIPLTGEQKSLVGDWYCSGRVDCPCHITQANDALFAINNSNSGARIIFDKKGNFFAVPWQTHGELVEDKILFSNGSWWSRKPSEFQPTNIPPQEHSLMLRVTD